MRWILLVSVLGCASATPTPTPKPQPEVAQKARADGLAAYDAKDFKRCADLFAQAGRAEPGKADDPYGEACCQALGGQTDAAFASLDRAVAAGWDNKRHLEKDPDLDSLRADPRWARLMAGMQQRIDAELAGSNPELRKIHDEDQGDRAPGVNGIDWTVVHPRDIARRKRVAEILDAGGAKVALDYYHAAMVFQHGDEVADFRRAHELAVKASELAPKNKHAKWLAAAAKDRELMNEGKPQLYGTQFRKTKEGVWELYQTDPTVTDDERARWNVPPIAEAQKRAEHLNKR